MKDFLPIISPTDSNIYSNKSDGIYLWNCTPVILEKGMIGAEMRQLFSESDNIGVTTATKGRGVFSIEAGHFHLVEDDIIYGASHTTTQDMKSTSAPGFAGNLGFNEFYLAEVVQHLDSGTYYRVIINPGDTSDSVSAEHGNVWYTETESTAPASISDADMPGNNGVSLVRGGASIDGYFFLGDITGKIYNSALNDFTTWTATNFLTAEREPDLGLYITKHHDHVAYFGNRSIEFFYNAGNSTGSPLARRSDVSYRVGGFSPNGFLTQGDIIYFVGVGEDDYIRFYKVENFQLSIVSNPTIEAMINYGTGDLTRNNTILPLYPRYGSLNDVEDRCFIVQVDHTAGKNIIFTMPFFSANLNIETGIWSIFEYEGTPPYSGGMSNGWTARVPFCSGSTANRLYQLADGRLANMLSTSGSDTNGNEMGDTNGRADHWMRFPVWDGGTDQKKKITSARILTKPRASSQSASNNVVVDLRWADFEDQNRTATALGPQVLTDFAAGRTVDLGVRGAVVRRLGTTRARQFLLDWTTGHGPISAVLGLEIDYEVVGE